MNAGTHNRKQLAYFGLNITSLNYKYKRVYVCDGQIMSEKTLFFSVVYINAYDVLSCKFRNVIVII